jgi:nucleotide-binding universal stress UspA family protein
MEDKMYKKIVVPLDGSKMAEAALPQLEEIAGGCGVQEILLISVTEKISGRLAPGLNTGEYAQEKNASGEPVILEEYQTGVVYTTFNEKRPSISVTVGKMAGTADRYLCNIAEDLEKKGFPVTAHVLVGNPAEEIINFTEDEGADLIIMASRGHSGFSRWDMGNIADKVIRHSKVPVLLVKLAPDFKETKPKRHGSPS